MSAQPTAPPRPPRPDIHSPGSRGRRLAHPAATATTRVALALRRAGPWLLRGSLAIVLVWFGGLKVAGVPTLTAALIAAISPPFVDAPVLARVVGGAEVLLGLGLLARRWQPLVLAGVSAQLAGTFLVLLVRPDVAFINANPLTLTAEGEYVVKNLVLLAAHPDAGRLAAPASTPHRRRPHPMTALLCSALLLPRRGQPARPASRSLSRRQDPPRHLPSQPGRRSTGRHTWTGPQSDYGNHGGEYLDDALRFADTLRSGSDHP